MALTPPSGLSPNRPASAGARSWGRAAVPEAEIALQMVGQRVGIDRLESRRASSYHSDQLGQGLREVPLRERREAEVHHLRSLDRLMSRDAISAGNPRVSNGTSLYPHKESLWMRLSRALPLNALRAFDAVARLSSFTRAGDELGMTQTAVSYQIKLLEEVLGVRLFDRRPRQVELTEAGRRLAPKVDEAFGLIGGALASLKFGAEETLTITTTPTFAAHWLSARIGRFQLAAPHIAVRMIANVDLTDFARDSVDVAIRYGTGVEPGLAFHELMRIDYTPMLSPRLLDSVGPLEQPRDLLRLRLIDPDDPWWRHWFEAAGVRDVDLEGRPRVRLGSQTFEASAAIAGHGVAILTPAFYRREIASGLLAQPFPLLCSDDKTAYWLTYPETRRNQPKIRIFRNWLLDEIADKAAAPDSSATERRGTAR
jgi:LysR family glycine cleavage system transcriptional activator